MGKYYAMQHNTEEHDTYRVTFRIIKSQSRSGRFGYFNTRLQKDAPNVQH